MPRQTKIKRENQITDLSGSLASVSRGSLVFWGVCDVIFDSTELAEIPQRFSLCFRSIAQKDSPERRTINRRCTVNRGEETQMDRRRKTLIRSSQENDPCREGSSNNVCGGVITILPSKLPANLFFRALRFLLLPGPFCDRCALPRSFPFVPRRNMTVDKSK